MASKAHGESLEKELLESLRFGGLDKTNLAELVRIVVDFNAKGIRPGKVFPNGITVSDGLRVQATLNAEGLAELVNQVATNARIRGVVIFPYGIVAPDVFQTQIDLG
jgi:hypothetical protein